MEKTSNKIASHDHLMSGLTTAGDMLNDHKESEVIEAIMVVCGLV